jgi:hypothetical protein
MPTLALHGINWEYAGIYHLINEESTGGGDSAENYQLIDKKSTRGRGTTGKYQLIYSDSGR